MSIASDLRAYADNAAATVQAQLNDVTGQAGELYGKTRENVTEIAGKAGGAVNDLRASAEKAINLEAIRTAVEPYLAQAKDYTASVTDRAEVLFAGVKSDKRVVKLVDAAKPVVDVVQERVVKPVQSLTGLGSKPAPAPKAATKPAATTPAAKPAAKPAVRKVPAKRATKA